MANVVEVTVRVKDAAASDLKKTEANFKSAGAASGKGFSSEFSKSSGQGLLGGLFGKGSGSVTSDAQKMGQNVGLGLGRGIEQKFSQTLGSGLLSGLMGTSGGNKLFSSAGNTVVQDAARQGNSIAQGLGKGLNDGLAGTQGKISGVLSGLFGGGGGSSGTDAQGAGESVGKSFTRGLNNGFSRAGSSVSGILSGLFGGSGTGPDEKAGEDAGKDAGSGFVRGLTSSLSSRKGVLGKLMGGLLGGGGSGSGGGGVGKLLTGGGGGSGGVSSVLDAGGAAGGALPGIGPISGMAATITGLAAVLVAVLPAITSVVGGLGAIGGGFAILMATNKSFAADMTKTMSGIKDTFAKAAAPLAKPLEQAASQIGGYFKQLEPEFQQIFGDSGKLVAPLVKAFEGLMSGALPGFLSLIKSGGPVFAVFASSMTDLGKDLGELFSDFASAGPGSASILKSIMDVVGSLLPFIGALAKILVSAVAPAFAALSGAIQAVLPALKPLMSIVGQFAGAVLTDLAGVLASIGTLLVDLAPSFTVLAKAASGVFAAMENDGVFASLGNALENLAGPLANLVNALVEALLPSLPGIISAFSDFAKLFTTALTTALAAVATLLTAIIKAIPVPVITALVDAFVAWWAIGKLLGPVLAIIDVALSANPIVLVTLAVIAIAAAFYTAWEKSSLFRHIIEDLGVAMVGVGIIIVKGAQYITNSFMDMVGAIIHGAADAFGWVPGLGGKLQGAAKDFDGMQRSVNNSFNSMIGTLQGFQQNINGLHGKTVNIDIVASGQGGVKVFGPTTSSYVDFAPYFDKKAAGGLLAGFGGGDILPTLLEPGEAVVDKNRTRKYAGVLKAMGVPGFASGGIAGWGGTAANVMGADAVGETTGAVQAAVKAIAAAAKKTSDSPAYSGPGGGSPLANMRLAQALYPAYASGPVWDAWNSVAMAESGWNQFALNPSSGAYGIAQALPATKYPFAGQAAGGSNPTAQITWMWNYMAQRWGGPIGAWQNEQAEHWYANGGATSAGWSVVGERGRELVKLPGGASVMPAGATNAMLGAGGIGDLHITLELGESFKSAGLTEQQLRDIRYTVRTLGGKGNPNSVQKALGSF